MKLRSSHWLAWLPKIQDSQPKIDGTVVRYGSEWWVDVEPCNSVFYNYRFWRLKQKEWSVTYSFPKHQKPKQVTLRFRMASLTLVVYFPWIMFKWIALRQAKALSPIVWHEDRTTWLSYHDKVLKWSITKAAVKQVIKSIATQIVDSITLWLRVMNYLIFNVEQLVTPLERP